MLMLRQQRGSAGCGNEQKSLSSSPGAFVFPLCFLGSK
jgi:hypothetical protein